MNLQALLSLMMLLFHKYGFVLTAHVDNCNLLPSELGPDWYKVPRPIPTGFEDDPDYQKSFVHMPCAATTVFDIAVCSCTNLMSFIFTSMSSKNQHDGHGTHSNPPIKRLDIVKETRKQPAKPVGTRLLNTKTGEVRHCPFRASSHGPQWYLVHEPTDTWRPMRCAPATLFEKRSCTCVHKELLFRETQKPEDGDIVVLEEEYKDSGKDDTIIQSLGISVSDIDFSKRTDNSIPFWRRKAEETLPKPAIKPTVDPATVLVTLNGEFATDNKLASFNLGKDEIAKEHKKLLKHGGKELTPSLNVDGGHNAMYLDLVDSKKPGKHSQMGRKSDTEYLRSNMVAVEHTSSTGTHSLGETMADNALSELSKTIASLEKQKHGAKGKGQNGGNIKTTNGDGYRLLEKPLSIKDDVYFSQRECSKKPMPELGPQYFRFFMWGIGYMPYTCYGNQIYDHSICACVPVPADSTINEINIPVQDCTKTALPELGPRYFKSYMWRVGYVAYACHGDRVFNQERCACIQQPLQANRTRKG